MLRLITLILILIVPTWAAAWKMDDKVTFPDIGPVKVYINDSARNGCWTNIKEAKNYAEGQIEIAGGKTVDKDEEAFVTLNINVLGERWELADVCYGMVDISVTRPEYSEPIDTIILYSMYKYVAINPDNFNTVVLDVIKEAVGEWR